MGPVFLFDERSAVAVAAPDTTVAPAVPRRRVTGGILRWNLKCLMRIYLAVLGAAERIGPRRRIGTHAQDVLLTLNFHAPGWGQALLGPFAASRHCRRLRVVTTAAVTGVDGVEAIRPPRWLRAASGATLARLATFVWVAIRTRPDVVGGVHLLFNGLVAALVARATGSRALYVCVGGPNELVGGGIRSENRLFGRLSAPDASIENHLVAAARRFDLIVTMGTGAAAYFRERGVANACHVIPCGVRAAEALSSRERDVDVVVVARLAPIKRIDLFVETIGQVAAIVPWVRAVVVGEGPMRASCEALASRRNLTEQVRFVGYQPDVSAWLARAKVFLLTSDSEGVSISLIEAMGAGAVPVVSDVGDLGDVVQDGTNGFLVEDRTPAGFSRPIIELLTSPDFRARLSTAARATARNYEPASITRRWDSALADAKARDAVE